MNLNTWKQLRHQTVCCFEQSRDALFELVDALCSEPAARSRPEWSLSPSFRRKWPSVYEVLEDGKVNERRWSQIWTLALLEQHQGPVWVGVESTSIARPEAEASPDRSIIYLPNLPHAKRPVSVGWQLATVMLLPNAPSSWGAILSQRRIRSTETAAAVAIQQLEGLVPCCHQARVSWRIAGTRRVRLCWPASAFLSTRSCASSATGNSPVKHHCLFQGNAERPVRMATCFREASPRPGANQMPSGKAMIVGASPFLSRPGSTCTFGKRGKWN